MNQKNKFEYINSNIITLSDFAKTSTLFEKRLAKPFYSKTILQIVSVSELIKSACYDFLSGSVDFKMKKIYLTA